MKMFGLEYDFYLEETFLFSVEGKFNNGRKFALFLFAYRNSLSSFMMKCQKVEFDFKAEIGWKIISLTKCKTDFIIKATL